MTDFEAIHEITQLKYRYMRAFDTKDWELFESCFAPEATSAYSKLHFDSLDEIMTFMRTNVGEGMYSMHQVHHPEIEVDGDTATGTWHLQDKVMRPKDDYVLEGAAIYADRYRRTEDGWKIVHTGYTRLWETMFKPSEIPSWRLR